MQSTQQRSRGLSPRAAATVLVAALILVSAVTPALAGKIERFTGDVAEVGLELRPGIWDATTTITFPPDCRVKDLSFMLRSDQTLHSMQVLPDGGNVTAWASKPVAFDPRSMDMGPLTETAFTTTELTQVSLNSTATAKTTLSTNASAHLFDFDVLTVLGGYARDVRIEVGWLGIGIQQGHSFASDDMVLYVRDHAKGMWTRLDGVHRASSTGEQVFLMAGLAAHDGWTDGEGHLQMVAVTVPKDTGLGSSLTTSFARLVIKYTKAPGDLEIDVAADGTAEFGWDGVGTGLYGLQNQFAAGSMCATAAIEGLTNHTNLTSFLVPVGADIHSGSLAITGVPGDVTAEGSDAGAVIEGQAGSLAESIGGIPGYALPYKAQVVLSGLKNAGMEDQKQTSNTGADPFGSDGNDYEAIAQTFSPSVTGKLVSINVSLSKSVPEVGPNISVELHTTNATGYPTGVSLGHGFLNGSKVTEGAARWYRIEMDTPIPLDAGTNYSIILGLSETVPFNYQWWNHRVAGGGPYAKGASFYFSTLTTNEWIVDANTDQAFVTYMETEIGSGIDYVFVNGRHFTTTQDGPSGPELVWNLTDIEKDELGAWNLTITNGNAFPIAMNWSAVVHSDVYPQDFGLDLATPVGNTTLYWPWAGALDLSEVRHVDLADVLPGILAGAPTAYTSPSGVEFARVNVSLWGNVTGAVVLDGLRLRYFLDHNVTGASVVAAAEAYRVAHAAQDKVDLPIAVRSGCAASVLLSGPRLVYDLRPFFVTTTQTVTEDGNRSIDLDTLFGDDIDHGSLRFELRSVSDPANMTATVEGPFLNLTPAPDYYGELDVLVRGIDSSDLFRDGNIHVVVTAVNDLPVLEAPAEFTARARATEVFDLAPFLSDVDTPLGALELSTNSSFISVEGTELHVTFDEEGRYNVTLTISDGGDAVSYDLVFNVSTAVGFPSISESLPDPMNVHINRDLRVDLSLYGSDVEDPAAALKWTVQSSSTLFAASINASGHWLIITPSRTAMGEGSILLTLTDTEDHTVSRTVTVEVIDRLIEPPKIDTEALPDLIKLKKDGPSVVLRLDDFVTDDTPAIALLVSVTYGADGIVYVDAQGGNLTFVPQGTGRTRVTVTLTDSDSRSSTFGVDVEVTSEGAGDEFNWWFLIVVLIIVAAILAVIAWPKRSATATAGVGARVVGEESAPRHVDKVRPHVFSADSLPQLEEVLLFHKGGKLLSQHTRRLREGVDADIEAGVISAIQDNLRGRSRTRGEPPDLIELEGMRVVIERGADLAIASVLTGTEPDALRVLMRRTLHEVQSRNDSTLKAWEGEIGALRGIDNAIVGLVESLVRDSGAEPQAAPAVHVEQPPRRGGRSPEPSHGGWVEDTSAPPPPPAVAPLQMEEDEPLKLVKGIIGEDKVHELREGRPKLPVQQKDEALVQEMLDREKEREPEEEGPPAKGKDRPKGT